eukprot:m.307206 g.307206  ORF g.307206 m.307206 type:complete len:268 (+) comp42017_c0_seq1:39-842(+)
MATFHRRCGQNIRLEKDNTVARRAESYNRGVVYSGEPLEIGEVFSVRFDEKEGGWAGGFRMGVCICDPEISDVPSGVLDVYNQEDHWVLSGSTLHHNHDEVNYAEVHLEGLKPGDVVGVMVTEEGELHFFLNGEDKGSAATELPVDVPVWMIGDVYGQAKQITVESSAPRDLDMCEDLEEIAANSDEDVTNKVEEDQSLLHMPVQQNIFGSGVFQIPVHMDGLIGSNPMAASGGFVSANAAKPKKSRTKKKHKPKDGDPYLFEGVTG